MVWSPGGYRFYDYTVFGGPLQLIVALVTIPICLYENTWIIWTAVLGLANVIVLTILLALNWKPLGDLLGLNKNRPADAEEAMDTASPYDTIVPVDDAIEVGTKAEAASMANASPVLGSRNL